MVEPEAGKAEPPSCRVSTPVNFRQGRYLMQFLEYLGAVAPEGITVSILSLD